MGVGYRGAQSPCQQQVELESALYMIYVQFWKQKTLQDALSRWKFMGCVFEFPITRGSPLWKMIINHQEFTIDNVRWLAGNGMASFRMDNWMRISPLIGFCLIFRGISFQIRELVSGKQSPRKEKDVSNVTCRYRHYPKGLLDDASTYLSTGEERLIWQSNNNGCFPTKSAWDIIRDGGVTLHTSSWLWQKSSPNKISIQCFWDLNDKLLSANWCLYNRWGFHWSPSLNCCPEPLVVSLNHLFLTNGKARS